MATSLGSTARGHFFESFAIRFLNGLDAAIPNVYVPPTRGVRRSVSRVQVVQGGFAMNADDFYAPSDPNLSVIDAWSAYGLFQITAAKRHDIKWENEALIAVIKAVRKQGKSVRFPGTRFPSFS